jgi:uncharacterized protein
MRDLILNVRDLVRKPGDSRQADLAVQLAEPIEVGILSLPMGSRLSLDLLLESVEEGILASGTISAEAQGQCSRCLEPVALPVEVDFEELFAYSGVSDDDLLVVNDQIDLNQVVIDSVVLSLPFQPVCSQTCEGLCPDCGTKLEQHQDHNHEKAVDARWAPLSQLKLNQKDD